MKRSDISRAGFAAVLSIAAGVASAQQSPPAASPDAVAFFESKVRPVLAANCTACHSAQLRSSGLSFESRATVLQGGNRGAILVPGKPDESLLISAIEHRGDLKMPPGGKLSTGDVATLRKWVEIGMPWGADEPARAAANTGSAHWAFQPLKRTPPPAVKNAAWVRNPIDQFVLARLEEKNIQPSPVADRRTLIRRVSLDLVGLPPSPEEIEQFVNDARPDAYERLVDRLLESPHYGERWGRHWLDIARYADSNGYNIDGPREIWMYRDWVINALNNDQPFDRFVIEQLAGDMLPNATKQQIVATGFHRNTLLNLEGGIDFEQYRVEAVVDRVSTTGAAFLGLTLGCARCHDHKYDPISQREFYSFYSFFNNIDELGAEYQLGANGQVGRDRAHEPLLEFGTPEEFAGRQAIRDQIALLEKDLEEYEKRILPNQPEWERSLTPERRAELKPDVVDAVAIPAADRNDFQKDAVAAAFKESDPAYRERRKGIAALRKVEPSITSTMVMRELEKPRQAYVQLGGDFLRKGIEVRPTVPAVLPKLDAKGYPTRLDLARWLVSAENPLTPRVTVNRVWQRYFGKGIVATENDFGTQGAPPTHPELLDWLAATFIDGRWSMKAMHRLIVNSATYRQSSRYRPELLEIDANNQLLSRQNRLRLEGEIVRDAALAVSGLLTEKIGGPSVFPPQPAGAGRVTQINREWKADTNEDRYRRGMYTYFWRSAPHPGLMVFDGPDSTTACTRRGRSNTPLQALTLLNDEAHIEFAQALARRVLKEAPGGNAARIERAFELSLGREPNAQEREQFTNFVSRQLDDFLSNPEETAKAAPADDVPKAEQPVLAAWMAASRILLNLDEFITRE